MYRKELKFILPEYYLGLIESRIKCALKKDEHQIGDYYVIRSAYFDSPADSCFYENLSGVGVSPRKKYRIRVYGNLNPQSHEIEISDKKISAEIKTRYRDAILKQSTDIDRELCESIIRGDYSMLSKAENKSSKACSFSRDEVLGLYYNRLVGEYYRPKTIVEYKRSAYIYTPSNVRITFDRDINASSEYNRLFDNNLHGIPVMDIGNSVLEVKYDEFLPDEIRMILADIDLSRTSCSKYCMCRETILNYGR